MSGPTQALQKSGGAWIASLSFCLVYLISLASGAGPWTVMGRSIAAAMIGYFVGRLFMKPLCDVIFDVLAEKERLKREAEKAAEGEESREGNK